MNNPLKDFDQIKVSSETKNKTINYVLQHKKKKNYFQWKVATLAIVSCILFVVVQGGFSTVNPEIVTYVSIDINPSIQFTLDKEDKIINVVGLNEDANPIITDINILNKSLEEAMPMLFLNPAFQTYLKEGILEVGVYSSNTKNSTRIEKEVNGYLSQHIDQGSYHCSSVDQGVVDQANMHHTSLGKYRVIDLILQYDTSTDIENLKQLSMKELYLILEKYDSSAIPANCHQNTDQKNQNQKHGKHQSSSHHKK